MGNGAAANDEQHKELSLTFAASSMIKETDFIDQGAYEANLKRIQEAKEIVRRLEMNNETAHKNFLVDQLEKRTQEGREAEVILARLKSQPGLPERAQFNNGVPNDNPEVILPTTATLVEVPESPSASYFTPASAMAPPQTTPQIRPVEYQWNNAPQIPQLQSYQSGIFRYYTPPSTSRPLHGAAPRSQAPVNGQMGWYAAPNVAPQYKPYNTSAPISSFQSMHIQQPTQPWNGHLHQVRSPSGVPANYTAPWVGTVPPQSIGSSSTLYRDPKFSTPAVASAPQVNNFNQLQNVPLAAPTPQVRVPAHGVAASSSSFAPITRTHPQPSDSQFRPTATTISVPATISEIQRSQPQPAPPAPQRHPKLQSTQSQRYSQELPSQQPIQPSKTHPHVPARSAEPVCSIPQALAQPSQAPDTVPAATSTGGSKTLLPPSHPYVTQEQTQQGDAQIRADQATFIKLFQVAVQRGASHLKAFLLQAKACGISDDWFRAAFSSMSRDVWESLVTQANQATVDASPTANVPQDEAPTISGSNLDVPVVNTGTSATPIVRTTVTPQSVVEPNTSSKGSVAHPAKGQTSQSYAAQLQYYAEQATKLALFAPVASGSTSPGNTPATLTRDGSQPQAVLRTPKDANKSTLARDILRSLGKMPHLEVGGRPNDHEDQLSAINLAQEEAALVVPRPPEVFAATSVNAVSDGAAEPQEISFSNLPKEESGPPVVTSGPIMIDLTLDCSDESVDGQREQPTFPIQTSTSPQPDSRVNTTNRAPPLENFSLEERSIDIGDDADVRMYSPPLSMHADENMESERLYPQLGATGLVSPNFGSFPHEASGHAIDGQLPLFLPSPPVSPAAHTEPPETVLEMVSDEGQGVSYLKRRAADIDEKEVNTEPVVPRVRKRRKQVYVLMPRTPLYVKEAIEKMKERAKGKDMDSELDSVMEDEELRYSPLEQLLIEESKSRLLERRCRWLSCGAILNCAAHLFVHLKNHVQEEDSETPGPFLCRWSNCQRQFSTRQERDPHLERHTTRPLPCPFAGCDEQFNKPVEVMQHEVQHQQAEHMERLMHKQTCRPVVPAIPARLGQPPHRLPSYRVIPRRVVKCRISAERHATMGPWVLWNIFSPVELNTRKQNASMRGRPMRQAIQYEMNGSDPRRDDYDFLLAPSTYPTKNPQLDNLDSSAVTMSAARGLTLWGSEDAINKEGSATPEEEEEEVLKEKWEGSEKDSRPASPIPGEEDAVERMLIL